MVPFHDSTHIANRAIGNIQNEAIYNIMTLIYNNNNYSHHIVFMAIKVYDCWTIMNPSCLGFFHDDFK